MKLSLVRLAIVVCLISTAASLLNLEQILQSLLGLEHCQPEPRCSCGSSKPKERSHKEPTHKEHILKHCQPEPQCGCGSSKPKEPPHKEPIRKDPKPKHPKPKDPIPSKTCSLEVTNTSYCVAVKDGNSASGAQLVIYKCNGTPAQEWIVVPGDGTIRAYGKCMGVANGANNNETPVQLFDCDGTPAQQWTELPSGQWKNTQSEKCLDVLYAWIQDAQNLIIYGCKETNFGNQAFVSTCK